MSLESNENQELARDTSGPLSGAVWAAIRRFRLLVIYLGALGALLLAVTKLRTPLDQLGQFFNLPAKWLLVLIGGLPLASAFAFDTIPEWLRKRRDYKLSEYGVSGSVSQPGYFRIYPYENTQRDIERYQRPDGADEKILEWLSHASDSILYLTARSGAGKTSLLHASVLPRLRERSPAVVSITVRGYQRPVEALRQAVLKPGPIWTRPPAEALDFRALMDRACSHIRPCRLLIILDQFEESLIVQSKNELRSLREALLSVSNHPIDGLSFLLVVRSDYVGVLQDLDLPIMKQNQNWKEISPFLESAARDFLGKSNLKIGAQLLDSIMSDAAEIEETRGLIRPITLNMIGIVLEQIATGNKPSKLRRGEIRSLLAGYVRDSINIPEIRDHSREVLREMVTPAGTKKPRALPLLVESTKLDKNAVVGCLKILGNRGIVRSIDDEDKTWEVSHDFVARLLDRILMTWKESVWRRTRFLLAPISVVVTLAVLLAVPPYLKVRRQKAIEMINQDLGVLTTDASGYATLEFPTQLFSRFQRKDYNKDIDDALTHLRVIPNVRVIDLSFSPVSDAGLRHLKGLASLRDLRLASTRISDEGLANLDGMTGLERLSLYGAPVTDSGLAHLKGLANLRSLELQNTEVTDVCASQLALLTNLEDLGLSNTSITDRGLAQLTGLRGLQSLSLSRTRITDAGLDFLAGLPNLQQLDISNTGVTDTGLAHVEKLRSVKGLSLAGTSITDLGLKRLTGLTNLERLNLDNTQITDAGLGALNALTGLRTLTLSKTKVTDSGLQQLKRLAGLEVLFLNDTSVTNAGLEQLKSLAKLTTLYLANTRVTDAGLVHLRGFVALTTLSLRGTGVTDGSIEQLKAITSLRTVDLTKTRVTDAGIRRLTGLGRLTVYHFDDLEH